MVNPNDSSWYKTVCFISEYMKCLMETVIVTSWKCFRSVKLMRLFSLLKKRNQHIRKVYIYSNEFQIAPAAAAATKSLQSCPTLCNPIDSSPPGFPIPGILQVRTLEWVAIFFSNAWKWKVKVKLLSRVRLFATPWTAAYQAPLSMGFSRQKYWSGVPLPSPSDSPSQAQIYHDTFTHLKIFYYQLLLLFSCKSCPTLCDPMNYSLPASSLIGISQVRILEWVAVSFSRGSSWPRDWTHISCIGRQLFTTEPPGKPKI